MANHHNCLKRNVWQREKVYEEDHVKRPFSKFREYYESSLKRPRFSKHTKNQYLDVQTKRAGLKAASSVVSLSSFTGDEALADCCGVVIEKDGSDVYTVLTSAKLVRCPTKKNVLEDYLADSLKIIIHLCDGGSYEGHVCAYDFHYNIAWIRFQSASSIPTAKFRQVDDYISISANPAEEQAPYLRPHSSHFSLVPGQAIVAVGRYFAEPFDLMAAPGEFSIGRCDNFECQELFNGTCIITGCGEGGPVVNLSGEVIGITFFETYCTPFLPISIAQKCWEHYKNYGVLRRPFLGIVATNLYAASIWQIEKVILKNPNICNGVLVEKVIQGSSLQSAGLRVNDVIVQCGGKIVHSFLEFVEMVWDRKGGDVLKLTFARLNENETISVNMLVEEVAGDSFYRWPRNY